MGITLNNEVLKGSKYSNVITCVVVVTCDIYFGILSVQGFYSLMLLQWDSGMMEIEKQKGVVYLGVCQDLESMIHENAHFFDKLIELIPPKFICQRW